MVVKRWVKRGSVQYNSPASREQWGSAKGWGRAWAVKGTALTQPMQIHASFFPPLVFLCLDEQLPSSLQPSPHLSGTAVKLVVAEWFYPLITITKTEGEMRRWGWQGGNKEGYKGHPCFWRPCDPLLCPNPQAGKHWSVMRSAVFKIWGHGNMVDFVHT